MLWPSHLHRRSDARYPRPNCHPALRISGPKSRGEILLRRRRLSNCAKDCAQAGKEMAHGTGTAAGAPLLRLRNALLRGIDMMTSAIARARRAQSPTSTKTARSKTPSQLSLSPREARATSYVGRERDPSPVQTWKRVKRALEKVPKYSCDLCAKKLTAGAESARPSAAASANSAHWCRRAPKSHPSRLARPGSLVRGCVRCLVE